MGYRVLLLILVTSWASAEFPAPMKDGYLLANGWKVTPAGKHLPAKDTVLNLKLSPDGKRMAALSSGYNENTVMLIDPVTRETVQELRLRAAWLGLAWAPDGKTLYVSGGNKTPLPSDHTPIYAIPCDGAKLDGAGIKEFTEDAPSKNTFWAGLARHPSAPLLFACNRAKAEVVAFDTATGEVKGRIKVEREPYGLLISPDGKTLYCTNWGSDTLSVIDVAAMTSLLTVAAGDNPNDMVLLPDNRLAVCSSNDNSVLIFDTKELRFAERIVTSLYPMAPEGSTPNALAYDAKTKRLYVANALNNDVCVVDVDEPGDSEVVGFIPVGYYPAALALSADGHDLYVGNAKGLGTFPDPLGPNRKESPQKKGNMNIKQLLTGDVSIVDVAKGELEDWTAQCIANCPYNDTLLAQAKPAVSPSVVPRRVGVGSPIKHVLYIIKENRTYDQIFGDMKEGNGDPDLCLFGEEVTPNQHALARQFVLLDSLYCDAEVSANGHQWSNAAYASDYTEKNWPATYGGKTLQSPSPGGNPPSGFIWTQAARKGLTTRNYGEFALRQSDQSIKRQEEEYSPRRQVNSAPNFEGWGARDPENAKEFIREFDEYEKGYDSKDPKKRLPNLMVMTLPEDHTKGTKSGAPTPRAAVASNDYAVGLIVERISHSRYWPETAIFIIEDDAQDGSDHVDARRTSGELISAYTKRGSVDHTLYTTSAMLRTIELLLGLQPMSQYDAAATPMYASLGDKPDTKPYSAIPPRIDINEMNGGKAFGLKLSDAMDFSAPDRTPMFALNEIVWKSIKGAGVAMPLPVHRFLGSGDADAH